MASRGLPNMTWSVMAALRGRLLRPSSRLPQKSTSSQSQSFATVVGAKPDLKKGPNVPFQEMPIVNIKISANNAMFLMSDHNGRTVFWVSAGSVGFKNTKRGSAHASEVAGTSCGQRALDLGVPKVRVKIKGYGPGRQSSVKGIVNSGLEIVSITDTTPIPHNGCRPRKVKRV